MSKKIIITLLSMVLLSYKLLPNNSIIENQNNGNYFIAVNYGYPLGLESNIGYKYNQFSASFSIGFKDFWSNDPNKIIYGLKGNIEIPIKQEFHQSIDLNFQFGISDIDLNISDYFYKAGIGASYEINTHFVFVSEIQFIHTSKIIQDGIPIFNGERYDRIVNQKLGISAGIKYNF